MQQLSIFVAMALKGHHVFNMCSGLIVIIAVAELFLVGGAQFFD